MNTSVRSATTDDVPGIQRVADAAWRATYGDFLAERTIDAILDDWYSTAQLETTIESDRTVYLVAETDGEVVGYASAAPTANEQAQLYATYVDPDQWAEGAGTALLDGVLDRLSDRGVSRLRVEVLGDNTVGVSFYESQGFERTSERDRTVGDRTLPEFVYYRDV